MSIATEPPATEYKRAPRGFTKEQFATFMRDGILVIEDAIEPDAIEAYHQAIDRVLADSESYRKGETVAMENIVYRDPAFAELIDHPRHVGFAYDLFGELLKLHQSQLFVRTPGGGKNNIWHPDGARALPYNAFSPVLPLCIKVGYWLTDLPEEEMGNFVCIPGSHRQLYVDGYDTHEPQEGQMPLICKRGTMTIMNSSIWHMVQPNNKNTERRNFFIAYAPSWITKADQVLSPPEWLETLSREQRIIMRSYAKPYDNAKPPASEFPLYLDRDTGLDHDPGKYRDHVRLQRRRRITQAEKWLAEDPSLSQA